MARSGDRRWLVTRLPLGLVATPLVARAQPAARVYRVGCVWAAPVHLIGPYRSALEQRLQELGWVGGRNIVFEHRFPNHPSEAPALVEEVLNTGPDVIVAATVRAIEPAARATSTIPIVMMWGPDPVANGFAVSLARPGKNVTGLVSDPGLTLYAKQLELVKQILPNADRVLVIRNRERVPQSQTIWRTIEAAAANLRLRLEEADVSGAADIERVFDQPRRPQVSAVFGLDTLLFPHLSLIAKLAMRERLPSVFGWREFVDTGGLASYGINLKAAPRDAAIFVDKILRGAKPAELPIEQPTTFELAINLKTARSLGVTIPRAVIVRADYVIE